MRLFSRQLPALALLLCLPAAALHAATVKETIDIFKNAGVSPTFFNQSYGYAVFPTVGEGALVVGGGFSKGRVYVHGHYAGETRLVQLSVGFQAGGKAFDAERLDTRCGELDRQRQAVEPPANRDDQRGVRIGQREVFDDRGYSLDEELHGGEIRRFGGGQLRRRPRTVERSEAVHAFTRYP